MSRQHPSSLLSALTLVLLLPTLTIAFFSVPAAAAAAARQATPAIYNSSTKYTYVGCYNETTGIANTNGARTLANGMDEVGPGNMTVPACLDFCSDSGGAAYAYAGIEFARECWCGQSINSLSVKFNDSDCNLGCEGNGTQACGSALKLSIYMLNAGNSVKAINGALVLVAGAAITFITIL